MKRVSDQIKCDDNATNKNVITHNRLFTLVALDAHVGSPGRGARTIRNHDERSGEIIVAYVQSDNR